MKKALLILLIIVSVAKSTKGQTGVSDTLAYLQTIVANKSQFIGQPLSTLLKHLQINIKYFQPISSIHYAKSKETSTIFAFNFPKTANDIYLTYPSLKIYWQSYLDAKQSNIIWEANDGGGWSASAATFYSKNIIFDIKVVE